MGNSNGGLADYFAAFGRHDALQGGFVWEWVDHGIRAGRPTRTRVLGVRRRLRRRRRTTRTSAPTGSSGRTERPTPRSNELKFLAQPVRVEARGGGRFRIHNRQHFVALDGYRGDVGAERRRRVGAGGRLPRAARRPGRVAGRRARPAARGAASGSSRSASSCARRPSGRPRATRSRGSSCRCRAAAPGGARRAVAARPRTACSRPPACGRRRPGDGRPAPSSASTGATCSSRAAAPALAGADRQRRPARWCRAAQRRPRRAGSSSASTGWSAQLESVRVGASAIEVVHRAGAALVHAPARYRLLASGELRVENVVELARAAPRRAAHRRRLTLAARGSSSSSGTAAGPWEATPTGSPRPSSAASAARSRSSTCRTSSRRSTATISDTRRLSLTDGDGFGLEVQGRPTIGFRREPLHGRRPLRRAPHERPRAAAGGRAQPRPRAARPRHGELRARHRAALPPARAALQRSPTCCGPSADRARTTAGS